MTPEDPMFGKLRSRLVSGGGDLVADILADGLAKLGVLGRTDAPRNVGEAGRSEPSAVPQAPRELGPPAPVTKPQTQLESRPERKSVDPMLPAYPFSPPLELTQQADSAQGEPAGAQPPPGAGPPPRKRGRPPKTPQLPAFLETPKADTRAGPEKADGKSSQNRNGNDEGKLSNGDDRA
jgi:hypothetical protein